VLSDLSEHAPRVASAPDVQAVTAGAQTLRPAWSLLASRYALLRGSANGEPEVSRPPDVLFTVHACIKGQERAINGAQ
jgi:hypothetical protein